MEKNMPQLKSNKVPWLLMGIIKGVTAALSMQETALTEIEWGYPINIPIIKYFFPIFQNMDAWGMNVVFLVVLLTFVFYTISEHPLQKNPWLNGLSAFFGICMVFGRSYHDLGNWNYIFHGKLQFGLACFVMLGYYWLFKNGIIVCKSMAEKWNLTPYASGKPLFRENGIGSLLFVKHPFLGPLLVLAVCCLPVIIGFFPGTFQWDALFQLRSYIGYTAPWKAQHPVLSTWFMAQCLNISRLLFGSDKMTLFLYAGPQIIIQCLVFAYGIYVLCKINAPALFRWLALVYLALFPLWPIWGYTMVKDTYFYIFLFLLTALMIHILASGHIRKWQPALLFVSAAAVTLSRKNGIHILVLFCVTLLFLYRKYWKIHLCILAGTLSALCMENVYIARKDILPGPKAEMMSIPLLQTARYIKEHPDEITEEETDILSRMFMVELGKLPDLYEYKKSDNLKDQFRELSPEEMKLYWKVWFAQLIRHPDTYIQAFIDHTYGYFYPDLAEDWMDVGYYRIVDDWYDDGIEIEYTVDANTLWTQCEIIAEYVNRSPVLSMFYSCGFHNYILIGCMIYLLACKKYRELALLLPSLITVIICLVSPVNAYVRYMLPVMAVLPLNVTWCFVSCHAPKELSESPSSSAAPSAIVQ